MIEERDNSYVCYYNYCNSESFLEEGIVVHKCPFFNKRSISNTYQINPGDIVFVEDLSLVEDTFNGESYKTYKVVWNVLE